MQTRRASLVSAALAALALPAARPPGGGLRGFRARRDGRILTAGEVAALRAHAR